MINHLFRTSVVFLGLWASMLANASVINWLTEPVIEMPMVVNNDINRLSSYRAKISTNGRYISFISGATNLVMGDTNGLDDLFVYDVLDGSIVRVNTTAAGEQTENSGVSYFSAPTSDGQYVAFASSDVDLTLIDSDGDSWVFLKHLPTGAVSNISTYNTDQHFPVYSDMYLSDDALRLTFATGAQIDPLHSNFPAQVYRKNLNNGNISLLSKNQTQTASANNYSLIMDVSENSRFVLMASEATDLTSDPINNSLQNLFLYDALNQTTELINRTPSGDSSGFNTFLESAAVSNNGTVVFISGQSDLVLNDTNGERDVFIVINGVTSRLNLTPQGQQLDDSFTFYADIDDDAKQVVFTERSAAVVDGDDNEAIDVFLHDLMTGTNALISQNTQSDFSNGSSNRPLIAGNGSRVLFDSTASDLSIEPVNQAIKEFYHRNLLTQTTQPITRPVFRPNTTTDRIINPRMNQDQSLVIYTTQSPGFDPAGGDDGLTDLYLLDRASDQHELLFSKANGEDISPSGRFMVFTSDFTQPDGMIDLGATHIFLHDRQLNQTLLIDEGIDTKVNDDGHVVFLTRKAISPNDLNTDYDLYGYDANTQSIDLLSIDLNGLASGAGGIDIGGSGASTTAIFTSFNGNMVPNDTPFQDIYSVQWSDHTISKITVNSQGEGADDYSSFPRLSDNGRFVVFTSEARNLTNDDYTDASYVQLFVHDRLAGTTQLVSVNEAGLPLETNISYNIPGVSSSGRYVAYTYADREDETGFPADDDQRLDVILYDTQTQTGRVISNGTQFPQLPERSEVSTIVQVVEDTNNPSRVGVLFTATDAVELTGIDTHPGHDEVFLYQQGGPDLTLTLNISGSGQITGTAGIFCVDTCTAEFALGTEVTLIATADPGIEFLGWQTEFTQCDDANPTCTTVINRDQQVTAVFSDAGDLIFLNGFD